MACRGHIISFCCSLIICCSLYSACPDSAVLSEEHCQWISANFIATERCTDLSQYRFEGRKSDCSSQHMSLSTCQKYTQQFVHFLGNQPIRLIGEYLHPHHRAFNLRRRNSWKCRAGMWQQSSKAEKRLCANARRPEKTCDKQNLLNHWNSERSTVDRKSVV